MWERAGLIVAGLGFASLVGACGGSEAHLSAPDAGASVVGTTHGPGPLEAASGALALRVDHARMGGSLVLTVTIANGAGNPDVPLQPTSVQVKMENGLVYPASICDADEIQFIGGGRTPSAGVTLTAGASYSGWALCFEDPAVRQSTPVEVDYSTVTTTGTLFAATGVTMDPCTQCFSSCTYLDVDPENCGACGVALVDTWISDGSAQILHRPACVNGTPTCEIAGDTLCEDSAQQVSCTIGACGAVDGGVVDAGCAAGQTACVAGCTDLTTDDESCGTCGDPCPSQSFCAGGGCVTYTNRPGSATCETVCAAAGKQCKTDDNLAVYGKAGNPTCTGKASCTDALPAVCGAGYVLSRLYCACY